MYFPSFEITVTASTLVIVLQQIKVLSDILVFIKKWQHHVSGCYEN